MRTSKQSPKSLGVFDLAELIRAEYSRYRGHVINTPGLSKAWGCVTLLNCVHYSPESMENQIA
jgi:hypothetical protein